jgi:large subunit ribosomal protein L23
MAIFKNTKEEKAPVKSAKAAKVEPKEEPKVEKSEAKGKKATAPATLPVRALGQGGLDLSQVLIRPHVTEKATMLSERGVYAFEINARATKDEVARAIEKLYKVRPRKISVSLRKKKTTRSPKSGRTVMKSPAMKKAMVFLKKGDVIEFV